MACSAPINLAILIYGSIVILVRLRARRHRCA